MTKQTENKPNKKSRKAFNKKRAGIFLLAFIILLLIFIFKPGVFNNNFVSSVLTGKREFINVPEDTTGFRMLNRIPELDGPTLEYEIRLKFSEPISVDDFEVKVDKPGFKLKTLIVNGQPDTLWIVPEKRWVYDLPYNLTITSTNPDRELKRPIRIRYIFKEWNDHPLQFVESERPEETTKTPYLKEIN